MGKITLLPETTKNPITLIGQRAGICWGADITDNEKNYKRGLDCLKSNHGRTFEYVNIEMILEEYSARAIREWYTHIGGMPTRLQESTRYVDCSNFDYVIPRTVKAIPKALEVYNHIIQTIRDGYTELINLGIPKEDASMPLPFAMKTKMVDKRNLRNLIEMSHQRTCLRAYWEYRDILHDLCIELSNYSEEWKTLLEMMFGAKCKFLGYCPEKYGCGAYPKKKES